MSNTDQLYLDIFTTALEGGIGYWSQAESYRWSTDGGNTPDYKGFRADIVDVEDDDEPWVIDRAVIARGYRLAVGEFSGSVSWSAGGFPFVITNESLEDLDFDAGDADVVVQLGLFGEVLYG